MKIPRRTAASSLKDQYCCTSFMTSGIVDAHPCITLVDSDVSIALMLRLIPSISLSQSHYGCAWIANLLQIVGPLACTGSLHCIHVYIVGLFVACVTGLPNPSYNSFIATVMCFGTGKNFSFTLWPQCRVDRCFF